MTDGAAGSLLGLAWGDALGCPVEYWTADQIRAVHDHYDDLPADHPWDRLAAHPALLSHLRPIGLYSDDTQQAVSLLHSVLQPGGWSVDAWAQSLVRGTRRKAWRGTGGNFRAAVKRVEAAVPVLECGMPSAGIGAAMRTGPVGQLLRDDRSLLRQVVLESSLVTHADLRSVSTAYAVAHCCAVLGAGGDLPALRAGLAGEVDEFESLALSTGRLTPSLVATLAVHRGAVPQALATLLPEVDPGLPALRSMLIDSAAGHGIGQEDRASLVNHPFVLLGGVHAIGTALADDVEPRKALAALVREGGDADTVAAIAGSILGARFGARWVPIARVAEARWLERAAGATRASDLGESQDDFLRREAELSSIERRYARALQDPVQRAAFQRALDARAAQD